MAMEESHACRWTGKIVVKPGRSQATINMLPDIALLEIFDFYVAQAQASESDLPFNNREMWITLVHVCQKWREIVFESPRRLNLRLLVTLRKPVRTLLDIWPPFPIDISSVQYGSQSMSPIIRALEHDNRIRQINVFDRSSLHMQQVLSAMRKPFPALIDLTVYYFDAGQTEPTRPIIPDSFLGESAPRLQSFRLVGIPFPLPALKKLILSATNLVKIRIWRIPNSWYISPEEIVTCLSTLIRLKELELGFQSIFNPGWGGRPLPSSTRCVLPALTSLRFKGIYKYMEDLMPRIDAPQLDDMKLFIFDQYVPDAPQLTQFIGRPRFKALDELRILFDNRGIFVLLPWTPRRGLQFGVLHEMSNHPSVLVELCTSSFLQTFIPTVKHLYIVESTSALLYWLDDVENSQWLDILRPFTTMEDLYLSRNISPYIGPALCASVGEGMTEVLPALRNIFLERQPSPGPVEETMRQFVSMRQLSSHQIAISYWDGEHDPWFDSDDVF